ncbi:MAG: SusD family outer membrane lipoprotein NanU [Bacteroidales bacterium]|nr:SusD family outer membrane lipoprotein NanU [Bacteroidales bacterium]
MKKLYTLLLASVALTTSCNSLDLEPESTITDANYWKSDDQFTAFAAGCNTSFRNHSWNFYLYGEARADVFAGTPFGGEAQQGMENLYYNSLTTTSTVIGNYGGMYNTINQLNMLIAKSEENTTLPEATRAFYKGMGYGMRAYLYFHLLRSYGDAIVTTDYTSGSSLDLSNLSRPQDSAANVLSQIKSDLENSEKAFSGNYAFTKGKYYWSLAATEMLKGEVYLWSAKQAGGSSADLATAKTALENIKALEGKSLNLLDKYTDVFAFGKKNNDEIIFSLYSGENEYTMCGGSFFSNCVPQQTYLTNGSYFDENGVSFKENEDKTLSGLIRLPSNTALSTELYLPGDSRKAANVRDVYTKDANGDLQYLACFPYKWQGTMISGASTRSAYNDWIVYRYADAVLLLAEVKAALGEDITDEINKIRKRAYGANYDESTMGYPNDTRVTSLTGSDEDPVEAVLKERFRELIWEGHRWYDIRVEGKTGKYSSAIDSRLLWPIDQSTLTNNSGLEQTAGY